VSHTLQYSIQCPVPDGQQAQPAVVFKGETKRLPPRTRQ
jgi:hypothetical protein